MKKASGRGDSFQNLAPCYFPRVRNPSIVTAMRLNCCVRHGNRCFPHAMGTNVRSSTYQTRTTASILLRRFSKQVNVLSLRQTGAIYAPITSQLLDQRKIPLKSRAKPPSAQADFLRRTGHELYENTTHDGPDSKIWLSAGILLQSSKMLVLFWS